jgi:plasmid stabilization system protein ParE
LILMACIGLAPGVGEDFERIPDHPEPRQVVEAAGRILEIIAAIDGLTGHPLIGCPAGNGRRELVIGCRTPVSMNSWAPV